MQFGGQTAIKLAKHMDDIGLPILGTPADAIDEAEDRERFDELLERCGIPRPEGRTVFTLDEALQAAQEVGYPVLMRPSYVLGGQNMIVAYNSADVIEYMGVITKHVDMSHPVLMDKYILGTECEVDAICDGTDYLVPGIMQQVERTGVHSGDSICVYPPYTFSQKVIDTLVDYTGRFARELKVVGLVNVQYAVQNDRVYVIEVNPRSSRTVPYISKVTGVPMVDLAVRCTLGEKLKDMGYGTGLWRNGKSSYYAVKVPVYSFLKLHGVDTMLGPEMKSTGEVLGIAPSFPRGDDEGSGRGWLPVQDARSRLLRHHLGQGQRQGRGRRASLEAARLRLQDLRHARHRQVPEQRDGALQRCAPDERRAPQRHRPAGERSGGLHHLDEPAWPRPAP